VIIWLLPQFTPSTTPKHVLCLRTYGRKSLQSGLGQSKDKGLRRGVKRGRMQLVFETSPDNEAGRQGRIEEGTRRDRFQQGQGRAALRRGSGLRNIQQERLQSSKDQILRRGQEERQAAEVRPERRIGRGQSYPQRHQEILRSF